MTEWQIDKILTLLNECGKIALNYYDNPPLEMKADQTIVTAADKAIEARLAEVFDRPETGSYLIGEETVGLCDEAYLNRAFEETAWIVDPIDGTAPYSAHFPAWGISLALMKRGKIVEGAIYLPPQDEVIYSNGPEVFSISNFSHGGKPEVMQFKHRPLDNSGIISISQRGAKQGRFNLPNQVFAWSGCVASFYGLFTGRLLAYAAHVKLWDIAGSIPLLQRGGYLGITDSGKKLTSTINNELFELAPASDVRWRLRGNVIVAADAETINYIRSKVELS